MTTVNIKDADLRTLSHIIGHDADGYGGRMPAHDILTGLVSEVSLPAGLGWDATTYPITSVSYRDLGRGIRKGAVTGYSPWTSAEYLACRNGTQIYVSLTGNDSTGNGSAATPYRTPNKAISVANAAGVACTIRVAGGLYTRSTGGIVTTVPTVPICLLATGGIVQMGSIDTYTWTADTTYTNLYTTARSAAVSVYDMSQRDRFGNGVMYRQASSVSRCNTTPGSWYTDGTTVYVNPFNGAAVTDQTARVFLNVDTFSFSFGSSPQHFFMDAEDDDDAWDLWGCRIKIYASAYGAAAKTLAMRRVSCRYGHYATSDAWNNFGFDNWWGLIWLEECYGARAYADVFNFHNTLNSQPLHVVTLNCAGRDAGVGGTGSNNGLTMHENIIGIDVAGDYEYMQGGTLRNINTTKLLAHGSRYAKDRGDLYVSGGLVPPTEVGTLNTAQIWLSECDLDPNGPTSYALNPGSGTSIFLRNMPAVRGRVGAGGTVGSW